MSKKVFIDYGHYNCDSGAVGNGLKEVNINASYGKALADYLISNNVDVKIGYGGSLYYRSKESNSWGADVFVSLHTNAGGGDGFEIYHCPGSANGNKLSTCIYNQVVNIDKLNNGRGVKSASFAVLRGTKAVATLVECAFIDNSNDISCIDEKHEQIVFGESIGKGILKYLGIDSSNTSSHNQTSSTSNIVLELQKELNKQGYKDKNGNNLIEDGVYGSLTLSACPIIKHGSKGNITKIVQKVIGVTPDGIFGVNTKNAVIQYQKAKWISADGIVGKNTWSSMLS